MLSRIINEFMSIIFFWTRAPKFRLSTRSYIRIAVLLAMLAVLTHGCGEPLWDSETAEIYGLSYKYLDNAVNEISPPNEASSVTTSTAIYVTFNHPMDKGSVEENFSLTPSAPGTFHWTDRFHFQYVPQNELAHDTTYTIQILSQASDVHGKIMASTFSSTFSTPSDNPSVFKVDPADGEDKVSPSDDIRITFNEPVDRQSATLAFALSPAIPGVFSWDDSDRTLVYNPDTALSMGTVYTITISTAIKDLVGNHMDSTFTSSFTTLEAYETERPVIVSIATMDEVTIHVLFSEPLDRYSAELPQHYDIAGLGVTAAKLLTDEETVELTTYTQGEGLPYELVVNNIMDRVGNLILQNSTAPFTGIHPPNLLAAYPESNVRVRLQFTEKLDIPTATTAANYSIMPYATVIRAEILTSEAEVKISTSSLSSGASYTVRVENVKDVDGNSIRRENTAMFVGL